MSLSARLSRLTPEQQAVLRSRLGVDVRGTPFPTEIRPLPPGKARSLSLAQERMWFLDRMQPGNPYYSLAGMLRLRGRIDERALDASFRAVVVRHDACRMVVAVRGGKPAPAYLDAEAFRTRFHDLSALPEGRRQGALDDLGSQEARLPFDLAAGPLLRLCHARLSDSESALILCMHHIISDAWSLSIFFGELLAFHGALVHGKGTGLAPLAVQYHDYAEWQRGRLSGPEVEGSLRYWQEKLDGPLTMLALPLDSPRPPIQANRGAKIMFGLPKGLSESLARLARDRQVTLFALLLALFKILLHRYTRQEDILVATSVSSRTRWETEGLIGLFINTITLRTKVHGSWAFARLLSKVSEVSLAGLENQHAPFELVVDRIQPVRDPSHNPLFQVMFDLRNTPPPPSASPGLEPGQARILDNGGSLFDISLSMIESRNGLQGEWEYDTQLFRAATMERMIQHFRSLAESAIADPETPVAELGYTSHSGASDSSSSGPEEPSLPERPVHLLFEERAEAAPDAIASTHTGSHFTYGAINRMANQLAAQARAAARSDEGIVAVLAERGAPFLAAVLGIFKAGLVYLPLDPSAPPAKLRSDLESVQVSALVADRGSLPLAELVLGPPGGAERPVLILLEDALEPAGADNPPWLGDPDSLAYVIFTSGSTGLPKGAMITHRGMANHVRLKVECLRLAAGDAVAQNASQCFDISVWQLLSPLMAGGCVHFVTGEDVHSPAGLRAARSAGRVTVLEIVPSMLALLIDELRAPEPDLAGLRLLVLTGEALPANLCEAWYAAHPGIPILNAYGPTECSDDVAHYEVPKEPAAYPHGIPIGTAVANLRLRLLDTRRGGCEPIPWGAVGEICVSGDGVGRGYLGQAPLTATVFLPDPAPALPGGRMYRTGDLGRLLPGEVIAYLGREDQQVKIRGFRIELGAIECAIGAHPKVRECAVLAVTGSGGGAALAGFAVPRQGEELSAAEVRTHLSERLPHYMVPGRFIVLDSLPLNANGKVDRKALLAMEPRPEEAPHALSLPRDGLEGELAGIWAEVLGFAGMERDANFFDLGGHSLLMAQVQSRVAERLGRAVPMVELFKFPTIASLAAHLGGGEDAGMHNVIAEAAVRKGLRERRRAAEAGRRAAEGRE